MELCRNLFSHCLGKWACTNPFLCLFYENPKSEKSVKENPVLGAPYIHEVNSAMNSSHEGNKPFLGKCSMQQRCALMMSQIFTPSEHSDKQTTRSVVCLRSLYDRVASVSSQIFLRKDGISSLMSKRKPGSYVLDRLVLGLKWKRIGK